MIFVLMTKDSALVVLDETWSYTSSHDTGSLSLLSSTPMFLHVKPTNSEQKKPNTENKDAVMERLKQQKNTSQKSTNPYIHK